MADDIVHVSCFKWGDLYSADDVNRLRAMFARHLTRLHVFHCVTDNPQGLHPHIVTHSLPDYSFAPRDIGLGRKLAVYMPDFIGLEGQLLVQTDIDVVLVGNVDFLFDRPEVDFMIARGRNQSGNTRGHGAVVRLRVGALPTLWQDLLADPEGTAAHCQHHRGAPGHVSEQRYLDWKLAEMAFFEDGRVVYFRQDCNAYAETVNPTGHAIPPHGARIVSFAGRVKPQMVMNGPYDTCRHAPFVAQHWVE